MNENHITWSAAETWLRYKWWHKGKYGDVDFRVLESNQWLESRRQREEEEKKKKVTKSVQNCSHNLSCLSGSSGLSKDHTWSRDHDVAAVPHLAYT